jgi:arylsulfatase A-like enzyme
MKPNRLLVLSAALLSLLATARAQNESLASIFTNANLRAVAELRTSIIYIQCHGLGYGDLSCYGQTNYETPNLDKLAAQGIRFTNFRPAGTNFTTALDVMMYGKKAPAAGTATIATRLQAAGYHTGLIGEWTLDNHPWTGGFDEFAGFLTEDGGRDYYAPAIWRFDPANTFDPATQKWGDWKPGTLHNGGPVAIYSNRDKMKGEYTHEILASAMCNFVRIHHPDQFNHFKPFFLLVNLPAPRSASASADEFPVPSDAPYTDEPWPQAAKNRAALITRLDGVVGQLFEQLKASGMSNNLAIFFSSSEAPEKFADAKLNFLSPNGTAVAGDHGAAAPLPMIVRWPERVPAGQVSNFQWTSLDFMPTALDISDVRPTKDLEGMTVMPVLHGLRGPDVITPTPPVLPPGMTRP